MLARTPCLVVLLLSLTGCSNHLNGLKKAAAASLNCPSRELEFEELSKDKSGQTFLVTGCERAVQYSLPRKGQPLAISEVGPAATKPAPVVVSPPPPAAPTPDETARLEWMRKQQEDFMNRQAGAHAPASAGGFGSPAPSGGLGAVSANLSCCVNKRYYACPDSAAVNRCGGAFANCMMDCMSKPAGSGCENQCAKQHPPDPGACSRDMSKDNTCR